MRPLIGILLTLLSFDSAGQQQEADSNEVVNLKPFGDTAMLRDSATFTVVAKFIVEANGKISKIDILKNNCKTCSDKEKKEINEEVINIIKKYPIAPAKDSKGKPRKTTYVQPLIFKLEEE